MSDSASNDLALARGVLYTSLALGFQRPTDDIVARLTAREARQALETAARVVDGDDSRGRHVRPCVLQLGRFRQPRLDPLVARYEHLFGHTARGLVCPFETEYGPDHLFRQPQALANIAGYYLAFGLAPRNGMEERVDHVSCECEFMAALCLKEAVMRERSARPKSPDLEADQETLEATCRAQRTFLVDHLARFGAAFATCLVREDAGGFYGTLAELLIALLETDCARLGVRPGPPTLPLRSAEPEGVPMVCGDADEIIQIQGLRSRE